MKKIKIVVVGLGYVGLSNALLLAQENNVTAFDIDFDKVNFINKRNSPLADEQMNIFLSNETLDLKAMLPSNEVYKNSDIVLISTPTNYNETTHFFNTDSVEETIKMP